MASQEKPPKAMSSRLLTMKFMQRAAASSPSDPDREGGHPNKRPRLSEPSSYKRHSSDQEAVQTALADEEQRRSKAIERQAAEAGDTKWTLNLDDHQTATGATGLNIIHAGYSAIDSGGVSTQVPEEELNEFSRRAAPAARKSYGQFKSALEKSQNPKNSQNPSESPGGGTDLDDPSDSDASGKGGGGDELSGTSTASNSAAGEGAGIKRRTRAKLDRAEAIQASERRKNKEAKLLSRSGRLSGSNSSPLSSGQGAQACFKCGSLDHKKRDCTKTTGRDRLAYGKGGG